MLIERKTETEILKNALAAPESRFVAVYGRRRIGKTFLIREVFGYRFTFQHAGLSKGSMKEQIYAFTSSLKDSGYTFEKQPVNWLEAFEGLKDVIRFSKEQKKIIFIDELSWMDTPKSNLMSALENFWNGFASARKDVLLIICASATSWMLSEVIHNKGGLYHRLTDQIHLQPFSLKECESYTAINGLIMNREQILQYYMVFGGVPYYWSFIKKGLSLVQNIDNILFAKDAPLKDEYRYLYASIFKKPEVYLKIVETLGSKKVGMTREELIKNSEIENSGDLTKKLDELENCGFIRKYQAFGNKTKNSVYQLIDCFTLFYLKFLKEHPSDEHFWTNKINDPSINNWLGLAFERVCLDHVTQIKNRLSILGVSSDVCSWYCKADADKGIFGSQIDLLIVRKDMVINLCEIKYSGTEYTITKKTDTDIRKKINDLQIQAGSRYVIFPTLITTYGLLKNSYSNNISSVVVLDDLFAV